MAKVEVKVQEKEEAAPGPLAEATRRFFLAGMGAMSLAQEETEEFFEHLVERGETVQKESRQTVRDMMNRRQRGAERARTEFEQRVTQIAGGMNIPTKSDIDALSAKIAALTQKVDELKKQQKEE
jgi:polyhydroxyalkanoate synthesis regulator phasin